YLERGEKCGDAEEVGFSASKVSSPHALHLQRQSYLSAEQQQPSLPASKTITFPLDLNVLVLTVLEEPFKHSLPPIP
ncbi:hypothetical protein H8959_009083, partial [Pygathrix nigripes]